VYTRSERLQVGWWENKLRRRQPEHCPAASRLCRIEAEARRIEAAECTRQLMIKWEGERRLAEQERERVAYPRRATARPVFT
jgi:hypothetical protein